MRVELLALSLVVSILAGGEARAGEVYRQLNASEIQARFVGKEVTDEVHWSYRFAPRGRLYVVSLGRASTGRWRFKGDALCLGAEPCTQVWMAGSRVEFRRDDGTLPEEGVLKAPASRF
ncbi:hypothetical protein QO001_006442 [Methylobacterium brachiatum]|jgi:hypothetical protein|uniref:Uncharacterized protein n=1 Tax=Methylobacterium brachiatum TaxID=269660 RepID=A0AAJ1X1G7_9HYPH|nr:MULTISPECIES: hypothetical protein [Methylobacterium]MCB4806460.1 hypothetical protein [Methylobacterium brachiatum]MDQ0547483.1 hypothetical protein [Methylobacterium brachiatum]WKV18910.1 hypothetical protein [Methylobacterium radiotolerans JCM 2831]